MSTLTEQENKPKRNSQAIASLVLGILAILTLPLFGGDCVPQVAGILAIIAGVRAMRALAQFNGQGRSLAIAGIVIGSLGLLVASVVFTLGFMRGAQLLG